MSSSKKKPQPTIEKWTKEEVHRWLMTEVKVHGACADRFIEEEVLGEYLVHFKKKDILDLGIKHGPAVKITSYLESLKDGSRHEPKFPAYVQNWTKEQVTQWLLQYVKIYGKYAERLQEEDVSGDCLVCFKKQDFLDLDVKSGPAVKILAELHQLNEKLELTLDPTLHPSPDKKEAPKPTHPELSLAQAKATEQTKPHSETQSKADEVVRNESENAPLPSGKASERKEIQQPKPQSLGVKRKKNVVTTVLPNKSKISVEIQRTLEDLVKDDLKMFHFYLQESFPRGKLEGKDTVDTTKLMTDRYGNEGALQLTIDILKHINQRDLAGQLEKSTGQLKCLSKEVLKKEANQGEKLKNLLTCGGNSLDNYDRFVVVVNKSSRDQVQYLQFLRIDSTTGIRAGFNEEYL